MEALKNKAFKAPVNRRVVGSSPTWGAKKPGRKTRSFCAPQADMNL